jgi:hypothetical protein
VIAEYAGNDQDENLNLSDCTDSEETEISNRYRLKKKIQSEKKDNTSDSNNKSPTKKDTKGMRIDSDSDVEEVRLSSLARTVENPGLESSISSSTSKVKNVTLDSDIETEERSLTNGSSRNVLLDSDSENEDMGVGPQANKYRSKRVLSGSDSESDGTSHCKRSRAIFSVDNTNTVGTERQHLVEETNGSIYVQKYKRRIIVSDEEDD